MDTNDTSQNPEQKSGDVITNEVLERFGTRFGIKPELVIPLLRRTAFKRVEQERQLTNTEIFGVLIVADQHNLNPFTDEIYAILDPVRDKVKAVVGVDGWTRIINSHPEFDGMEFVYSGDVVNNISGAKPCDSFITCKIFRKDRAHPVAVTEYLSECYVDTLAWNKKTRRQLRHKAVIQCARYAFSLTGILDQDEADAIIASGIAETIIDESRSSAATAVGSSAKLEVKEVEQPGAGATAKPIANVSGGLGALELAKQELSVAAATAKPDTPAVTTMAQPTQVKSAGTVEAVAVPTSSVPELEAGEELFF